MIDSDQKYEALIKRLDRQSRESPQSYRFAVAMLAMLGFGYLGGVFVLALALIVAMICGFGWFLVSFHGFGAGIALAKLGIPVLIGAFALCSAIVKSLFIKLPGIEGPEIRRETAPRLFAMLDEVAAKLKAPKFHRVFITDDFNAGVVQLPKFGFLGSNNYLIIGVPMMKALSEKHFRAVIAHELGHISGNHSTFDGWIYRQRITWMLVLSEIGGSPLIVPFLRWYAPYFNAYTFALARSDEYVADQCGAEVVGAQTMAESLVVTAVRGRYLHGTFWPKVYEGVDTSPQPNVRPFTMLFEPGGALPTAIEGAKLLRQSWAERSDTEDCHPCLAERLAALGFRPKGAALTEISEPPIPVPDDPQVSAAHALLGGVAPRLIEQLDQDWMRQVSRKWQEEHGKAQWGRQRLEALARQREQGALSFDEDLERAMLTGRFLGDDEGLTVMHQVCSAFPTEPRPYAMMGARLLDLGNPGGVAYLERAMTLDPKVKPMAQELISEFRRVHGNMPALGSGSAGDRFARSAAGIMAPLSPDDRFIPNGLSPQNLASVRSSLAALRLPGEALLVRRIDPANPARPQFVAVLDTGTDGIESAAGDRSKAEVREALTLPGDLIVADNGEYPWLPAKIRSIPGAIVCRTTAAN